MSATPSRAPSGLMPYSPSVDRSGKYLLLAPLQGLSFDAMVANGEGARHQGNPMYYRLILVHAMFAAFAFLLFTPAAIICARFLVRGPRPRFAMWGHIGFQIASLIFVTIAFISGYSAVGSKNWGKNPHHIIGATLYAGMIFQVFFGAFVRWRVNRKVIVVPPLHKMIHQWLGRALFMLGLAQIPLGLYVYGSPKTLFIVYAIVTFLFLASWFFLEYLRNRGWFEHRYGEVPVPLPITEMSEHHDESHRPTPDVEHGYRPVGTEDTPLHTPKVSRLSKISWFVNRRNSGRNTDHLGGPAYQYDTATIDSSRVPSAQSPAIGGLAPGPGRVEQIPPVPSVPAHYDLNHHRDSSFPNEELQQGYGNPTGIGNTALRDSATLGPGGRAPQQRPEAHIPQPLPLGYGQGAPTPTFGISPHSSAVSGQTHPSYHQPGRYTMPPSPGGYMEGEEGFIPTPPTEDSPKRPLPLLPHHRERSNDTVPRLPIGPQSPAIYGRDAQPVPVGGGESSGGARQPHVAVQVKLNPDGKSVTVRRLRPDEAERERRERSRARQDRALQREIELERDRQARRSQSGDRRRSRQDSIDRREMEDEPQELLQSPMGTETGSYTPSVGGQSSSIAGVSGGLLGRVPDSQTPSNSNEPQGAALSPLVGLQPVSRSPGPAARASPALGLSNSQRASLTSGGTAENSEIEQEIVKEQRRKKRREERAGTSQVESADGGFYGPQGSESQWT